MKEEINPYNYMKEYLHKPMKYKDFCEIMGIEIKTRKAKDLQLYKLRFYMQFELSKRKFYIIKVYNDKEMAEQFRLAEKKQTSMNTTDDRVDFFKIPFDIKNKSGVYIIQWGVHIYIGQTKNFRARFKSHWCGDTVASEILRRGGVMNCLQLMEGATSKELKLVEKKFIEEFSANPKYMCYNKRQNPYCVQSSSNRNPNYFNIRIDFKNKERVLEVLREMEIYVYDEK